MHKKFILIIIAVTLFTYSNSLLNGFVGDDQVVIEDNKFYRSFDNLPRLFQKDYLTSNVNIMIAAEQDMGSGSVAYRPVLSMTYFLDYAIWKLAPFGYHLTNVILHLLNCLLLYFLVFFVLKNKRTALFAALLFSVHPTKVEAVVNVGYRADVLSAFFALLSFLCFIRYRDHLNFKRNLLFVLSNIFLLLGLFTKESVIVLPVIFVLYDAYFEKDRARSFMAKARSTYLGYGLITVFYLFIYWVVFRNNTLGQGHLMGGTLFSHCVSMGRIFLQYMINFINPASVDILPPKYFPPFNSYSVISFPVSILLFVSMIFLSIKMYKKFKPASFFLLWFIISLAPISNIIPIPNPMAHRFLYLPSVGLIIVLSIILDRVLSNPAHFKNLPDLGKIIKVGIVALCITFTIALNSNWKNNYMIGAMLVENYPEHAQGYLILGSEYVRGGLFVHAKVLLDRALALGMEDPRLYHYLGICSWNDEDASITYFLDSINKFPGYTISYIGAGRILLFKGDYKGALTYLKKSIELFPLYVGYGYLIQSHMLLGEYDKAEEVFVSAKEKLVSKSRIGSLEKILLLKDSLKEPIDVGL